MHRITSVAAAVVIGVIAVLGLTGLGGTAYAGGPTSVLITQPGQDAGALYYDDEAYDALLERLPASGTTGRSVPPGGGADDYTLTWMVHDVSTWRFDRVRTYPDGTAWVSTTFTADDRAAWAPLPASKEVSALLAGVLADDVAPTVVTTTPEVVPGASPAAAPAGTAPEERSAELVSLTGWRWLLPGALLGLVVGAVVGRRRPQEEPRRVLLSQGS